MSAGLPGVPELRTLLGLRRWAGRVYISFIIIVVISEQAVDALKDVGRPGAYSDVAGGGSVESDLEAGLHHFSSIVVEEKSPETESGAFVILEAGEDGEDVVPPPIPFIIRTVRSHDN